jgi:nucleoside-diphosphate-sugar epimerase
VNKFAQRILDAAPLVIFGDGSSTRDYIHVSDLCRGIDLALQSQTVCNEVIHIATGVETSLLELAGIFLEIGGYDHNMIEFKEARVGEVERNFALYDYANKVLGYRPEVELTNGIAETFEYLKNEYRG